MERVATFSYTTAFDLTGFNPTTASITGNLSAGDQTTAFLNGNAVAVSPFGGWAFMTPISITTGFIAGVNTLTFVAPNTGGPAGLQAQIGATASTPEPGSLLLLGLGLVAVGLHRRRL